MMDPSNPTPDEILAHLWCGGTLRMHDGKAIFSPNVGPFHWQDFDIPLPVARKLVRSRRIQACCTHRPYHNVRYYDTP